MTAPALQVWIQGQGSVSADNLNTFMQTTDIVSDLRGFIGTLGIVVYVRGQSNPGDGGQGVFYWNATSTAVDNGVNVIAPVGQTVGRWLRLTSQTTAVFTDASVTLGTSASSVLAEDPFRQALFVHNPSATANIAIRFSGTAALNAVGSIMLGPGGYLLFDFAVMTNPMTAVADASSTPLTVYVIA